MQYLGDTFAQDEKIKEVLSKLGLVRNVNNLDRNFYSVWTNDWGFVHEIIMHAAGIAQNKSNAMQYLNKILSNWNSEGIKTLDKALQIKVDAAPKNNFIHNNYTKEQIASLITNLDEVEV